MLCFYFLSISIVLTYVIPILGLAKLIIFISGNPCPRHFRFQECAGKLPGLSSSIIPTLISHCHALLAIRRVFICTFSLTIWILRYVLFLYVLTLFPALTSFDDMLFSAMTSFDDMPDSAMTRYDDLKTILGK